METEGLRWGVEIQVSHLITAPPLPVPVAVGLSRQIKQAVGSGADSGGIPDAPADRNLEVGGLT